MLKKGEVHPAAKYFYGADEFAAPLWFEGRLSDFAIVIKRANPQLYYAHNLIPLENAYKNARLLGPVKSDWLKPVYCFSEPPVEQRVQPEDRNADAAQ